MPAIVPVPPSVRAFARPKSITTTRPARVSITFSGLKSRCTRPAWWIASSPDRNCDAISRASWSDRGPRSRSVSPSVVAVDVLHRDELLAVLRHQVEDAADVRGQDLACGADLAAEHLAGPLGLDLLRPHRLQRDLHPQLQVEGAEHLAHAAAAQDLADLIPLAEDPSGGGPVERHDGIAIGRDGPRPTHVQSRRRLLEGEAQQALRAEPPDLGVRGQLGPTVGTAHGFRQTGHPPG